MLLAIILISTFSYAQSDKDVHSKNTKFVYGEKGLEPRHFTVDVEEMDRNELLSKAKDWFGERYAKAKDDKDDKDKSDKTVNSYDVYEDDEASEGDETYEGDETDETGKAKKSKKFRFKAFADNAICFGKGADYSCEGLEYTIELRLSDGDYRFRPIKLSYKTASSKKRQNINLKKHTFYSKDGKIKEGYEKVSSQIETLLNDLNKSLLNYFTGKEQEVEW